MWLDIAASKGEKDSMGNRSIAEKKITSVDISKTRKLALECVAKNYQEC